MSARRSWRPQTRSLGASYRDQFVVDVYQAGAGTSHNMNTNEVLANLAAERLGEPRGTYTRGPPQRPRQHGPVHQRRVPGGHTPLDSAGPAGTPGGGRRPGRRARRQVPRVRPRVEDRTHAPSRCRADHAGSGIRRLRRQRASCRGGSEAECRVASRVEPGRNRRRNGTQRGRGLHGQDRSRRWRR